MAILTTTLTGCAIAVSDEALTTIMTPLVDAHAASLAAEDVADMRRTGRDLIATFDAATGAR